MEEIIQEALSKGVKMHVSGEFELASKLYNSVMKLQPKHADANHNMGLLKVDTGQDLEALPYLQTALQADTSVAQFWLSYIKALIKLDKTDEATRILSLAKESGLKNEELLELHQQLNETFTKTELDGPGTEIEKETETVSQAKPNVLDTLKLDKALRLAKQNVKEGSSEEAKRIYQDILEKFPKNKKALLGLAALDSSHRTSAEQGPPQETISQLMDMYNQGQLDAVADHAQALTQRYPNAFAVWNILGAANKGLGRLDEASNAFKRVTELKPDYADGYNNLGVSLQDQGKLEEAMVAFEKALSVKPNYVEAFNNMGLTLKEQGKLEEAIVAYKNALSLKPSYADVHHNLGNTLRDQGRLEEATKTYKTALLYKPNYPEAYNNMGIALKERGKLDDALAAFNEAISLKPDYATAYFNMGRLYWLQQDFHKAFEIMEWRWKSKHEDFIGNELVSGKPQWLGEDNQKVFVWAEQGIGDEIMFSSTLHELHSKSAKLIVECDKRLIPLYKRSFPKNIEFVDDRKDVMEEEYSSQIATGSLLKHFRQNLNDFEKSSAGWLNAESEKVTSFRRKLQKQKNDKIIGISWFTKSQEVTSQRRNLPIDLLAKYLQQIPVRYVNLQYGKTAEELSQISLKHGLNVEQIDGLDLFNDLDGLAALISACDIVLSIDNATVHMAGALGIDTKVLLPLTADERWGLNPSESYWYDSVTLYRQEAFDEWVKPLERLTSDLKKMLS